MIRRNYTLTDIKDNEIIVDSSKKYTFNDYCVFSEITETSLQYDDILLTNSSYRSDNSLILRNLNILFNSAINKAPNSYVSLNRLRPGAVGDILVSQGPGVSPTWKTFSAVFPDEVYIIESDASIILQNSTMVSTNFLNSPYILRSEYISDKEVALETKEFISDTMWFSHTPVLIYTPIELQQKSTSTVAINIDKSYPLVYNKLTRFIILDKNDNIRAVNATPIYVDSGDFQLSKSTLGWTTNDVKLFLGDHELKTSVTELSFEYKNFVINDVDNLKPYYRYDIDVWGLVNTFSSSLPITSSIIHGCIGNGFGLLIDSANVMKGFGSNTSGQINIPVNKYITAACGYKHSCAITVEGKLVSFGDDTYGQVTNTPDGTNFIKVVCAKYATAAITYDNELFIWGDLMYDYVDTTFSTLEVKDIAFGEKFFIIQKTDNKLYGYGDDTYKQISNIPTTNTFLSFDCGAYHVAAVNSYNTLMVWGSNANSQLTQDNTNLLNYKSVQCGSYYTIALKTDGSIIAFGNDSTQCVSNSSTVQKYNIICANYDNVLGFKNGTFLVKERYKKKVVSGEKFSLQVNFHNKGTIVNGIQVYLEIQ